MPKALNLINSMEKKFILFFFIRNSSYDEDVYILNLEKGVASPTCLTTPESMLGQALEENQAAFLIKHAPPLTGPWCLTIVIQNGVRHMIHSWQ